MTYSSTNSNTEPNRTETSKDKTMNNPFTPVVRPEGATIDLAALMRARDAAVADTDTITQTIAVETTGIGAEKVTTYTTVDLTVDPRPDQIKALRDLDVHDLHLTKDDYDAAYEGLYGDYGKLQLADWARNYLTARGISANVAAERGYFTGKGTLPDIDKETGVWTKDQQEWASEVGGRSWLLIPWCDNSGGVRGWQLRWGPGAERISIDKETGEKKTHKFDFPAERSKDDATRLVDGMWTDSTSDVVVIIESPVRADALRSLTPDLPIAAVGGITQSFEGKSNPDNPNEHTIRFSPDLAELLGGLEDRHVLWIPDSDHESNPNCNAATQSTIEAALDAGAASVHVVHVPETITHPRTGRVHSLGDGAGLDDYSRAMYEKRPGEEWLGDLLANALDGLIYIDRWAQVDLTDVGRAERVARRALASGRHLYVTQGDTASWHYYDGTAWGNDPKDSQIRRVAIEAADQLLGKSKSETYKERKDARSRRAIEAAVALAPTRPVTRSNGSQADLFASISDFEPFDWAEVSPAANGLIDLATGALMPHTPDAMNLHASGVTYRPGATSKVWDDHLRAFCVTERETENGAVYEYDAEKAGLLQEVFGAMLAGRTYDTWLIMVGAGGCGMSTTIEAVMKVLGGYAGTLAARHITGDGNQFSASGITNKRGVLVGEVDASSKLDAAFIKVLFQDADSREVEAKNRDARSVRNTATGVLGTNYLPHPGSTASDNDALARRTRIARFTRQIPEAEKDGSVLTRLAQPEVQEAILAWMVEGIKRVIANGRQITNTEASRAEVKEWLAGTDRFSTFIAERIVKIEPGQPGYGKDGLTRDQVFDAYVAWARAAEIPTQYMVSKANIVKRTEPHLGKQVRPNNTRIWRNWKLGS